MTVTVEATSPALEISKATAGDTPSPPHRAAPGTRIAYFTGHFPQASHTFFWREVQALRDLGCQVDIVSTRSPMPAEAGAADAAAGVVKSWPREAERQTAYLLPMTGAGVVDALAGLLRSGPWGWGRALAALIVAGGGFSDRLKMLAFVPVAARLARWSRRAGWQHVHVGFAEHAATIALLARRLGGAPYSVSLGHSIRRSGPHQHLKWSDAAFGAAISRYLADEIGEFFQSSAPCPVVHAPRGIDVSRFRRASDYTPWSADQGPARLVSCARITPNKGQDILVRAVQQLKEQHALSVELRLAGEDTTGDGFFGGALRRLIDELGVSDQVVFLGRLSPDEVIAELHAAHVAVIGASATYIEGWGNAIGEAVASGTPTVACRTGGVPETIEPGVNGLLAEPGDVDSMTDCLRQLLTDPGLAVRLSQAGPPSIARDYHRLRGAGVIVDAMHQAGSIQTQTI